MDISAVNKLVKLSSRLAVTAAMIREGTCVADVGCDHGKLSAWLILSGKSRFLYAIDNSKPSLQKAADLFVNLNITSMTRIIHADGLRLLNAEEVDDIVIAGLGSDTIEHIISDTPWLKDEKKHLVLVPNSHQSQLRRYLYKEGFSIQKELAVVENNHCYSVMSIVYLGESEDISNILAEIGKISIKDSMSDIYIRKTYLRAKVVINGLEKAKGYTEEKYNDAKELIEYIEKEYYEVVKDDLC